MNSVAADFLTRCFAPGETIALLLRRENPLSTQQRIVALERALAPRYLGWLAHENAAGDQHLCGGQSTSLRQPQTHQREHRGSAPSIYRHRLRWRGPSRCAPCLQCCPAADRNSLHIARQISGALARRRLRLRITGKNAQAARHCFRRGFRLHRLQPCLAPARISELQIRSGIPRHRRLPLRFNLESQGLPAEYCSVRCDAFGPSNS